MLIFTIETLSFQHFLPLQSHLNERASPEISDLMDEIKGKGDPSCPVDLIFQFTKEEGIS